MSSFFTLPGEIRNVIYNMVLQEHELQVLQREGEDGDKEIAFWGTWGYAPSNVMSRVCRQMRAEVAHLQFPHKTFVFGSLGLLQTTSILIDDIDALRLQTIELFLANYTIATDQVILSQQFRCLACFTNLRTIRISGRSNSGYFRLILNSLRVAFPLLEWTLEEGTGQD